MYIYYEFSADLYCWQRGDCVWKGFMDDCTVQRSQIWFVDPLCAELGVSRQPFGHRLLIQHLAWMLGVLLVIST